MALREMALQLEAAARRPPTKPLQMSPPTRLGASSRTSPSERAPVAQLAPRCARRKRQFCRYVGFAARVSTTACCPTRSRSASLSPPLPLWLRSAWSPRSKIEDRTGLASAPVLYARMSMHVLGDSAAAERHWSGGGAKASARHALSPCPPVMAGPAASCGRRTRSSPDECHQWRAAPAQLGA